MSRYGALFESVIALIAIAGQLHHSGLLKRKFRAYTYVYYTNLSNLAVMLYCLCKVALHCAKIRNGVFYELVYSPYTHFAVTMCITVTLLLYHFLLAPWLKKHKSESGFKHRSLENYTIHYIVPLLMLVDWLLFADKAELIWYKGLIWIALPLLYLGFVVLRARLSGDIQDTGSAYPYPFIDPGVAGWGRVALNVAVLAAIFVALSAALAASAALLSGG